MTSRQDWIARCEATLKGKAFDADVALQSRIDGPRAFRSEHAPWKILQRVDHADDIQKARTQADEDFEGGADGFILTAPNVAQVVAHLPLHKLFILNEAGDEGAESLRDLLLELPLDPARVDVGFGIQDPVLARQIHSHGFVSPLMKADGRVFHLEGADAATELGAVFAEALGRLRLLDFLSDTELSSAVAMSLAATQNTFETIAKFRAARLLWPEILKLCKLPVTSLTLHAETSRLMMAEVDAHTNILRCCTAAVGAGLGGADSICVLPFSFKQGLPNGFARRVARNMQSVLLHESNLWRVDDPAAGAGAIERRTEQLCEQAWTVMQRCERGDWPAGDIAKSAARPIIGVTKYQDSWAHAAEVESAS
jgi:methylmalonyl-CoA mutase